MGRIFHVWMGAGAGREDLSREAKIVDKNTEAKGGVQ